MERDQIEPTGVTDDAVSSAMRALRVRARIPGMPMPWEVGMAGVVFRAVPLMGAVGADPLHALRPGRELEPPDAATNLVIDPEKIVGPVRQRERVYDAATLVAKRRRIDDMKIPDSDVPTQEALRAWRGILAEMGTSSELFCQMLDAETDRIAERSFSAAFFGKPASTLQKRAGSMRLFIRWAHASKRAPFPLDERVVFDYVEDLLLEGAPPTRATSFKEALNFSSGFVGLRGVKEVLSSRRIIGSAQASRSRKCDTSKRLPLTKSELVLLEEFVCNQFDETFGEAWRDKTFAGFVLFCVYARLRVGDASRINQEPTLDVSEIGQGYIECGMLEHKTSYRNRARVRLPVAGSAVGVSGRGWAAKWLQRRAYQGLTATGRGHLMPAPGIDGTWSDKRLTTADCTVWLRELLDRLGSLPNDRSTKIGSHSLKATLLSWAGKYGLPPGTRRRLGGHVKPKDRSLVEYSRDELAGPLRELDRVITSVSMGLFDPDSGRSGRWTRNESAEAQLVGMFPAAVTPDRAAVASVPSSSTSSSGSLDSSASEINDTDSGSEGQLPVTVGVEEFGLRSRTARPSNDPLPACPEHGLVRNRITGILHGNTEDGVRMLCGRTVPQASHVLSRWPQHPYPLCRGCFRPQ